MGYYSLNSNTTGSYNVALGTNAGIYQADGSTALTDPDYSVYIGYNAKGKDNSDDNSIVIGANAVGIGANTVVLGNDNITTTALKGSVGIGFTSPFEKLEVNGFILAQRGTMGYDSYYEEDFIENKSAVTADTLAIIGDSETWSFDEVSACVANQGGAARAHSVMLRNDSVANACLLYTSGTGGASASFYVSKLPTVMIKFRYDDNASPNIRLRLGLGDMSTAANSDPANGIFFTNPSNGSTQLQGKSCKDSTCSSVNCSTSSLTQTDTILMIKVTSTSSISFYYDNDLSNGVSMTLCCSITDSNSIPTVALNGIISSYFSTTTLNYLYTDYFRVWQDDPVVNTQEKNASLTIEDYDDINNADIAENYPIVESEEIEAGTIVSAIGGSLPFVTISKQENDKNAIGIVSTSPNQVLGAHTYDYQEDVKTSRVALSGRVPLRIDPNSEPITVGDYITSSGNDGMGKRANKKGIVVGKALENWDSNSGKNKILVFVNLTYYDPSAYTDLSSLKIITPGWYRIAKINNDGYAKVRIKNSGIGSYQNLVLSVNSNQDINVLSNFTSGEYDISNLRINRINQTDYLEVYMDSVSENSINVSIECDDSSITSVDIAKVTDEGIISQDIKVSGLLFGVSNALQVKQDSIGIKGDLLSLNTSSNLGNSDHRWNDIYTNGVIRIGNSGDEEGIIRFNIENKTLEFSNDGKKWLQLGDLASQQVISPEYPGAILYADGSSNQGIMTSDADDNEGVFRNYYEWVSDKGTPQDYDILVRVTLPSDFIGWKDDAISLDFMTENSVSIDNNSVKFYLIGNSGVDAEVDASISKMPAKWERISINGSDISQCNSAGSTCTLRISLTSSMSYFTRVGDIILNYNRSL